MFSAFVGFETEVHHGGAMPLELVSCDKVSVHSLVLFILISFTILIKRFQVALVLYNFGDFQRWIIFLLCKLFILYLIFIGYLSIISN